MKFFLDTANLDEIRAARNSGLIDGVTTNPTLLAREGGNWRTQAEAVCAETEGPVSLEVVGMTSGEMIREAEHLTTLGDNVVVKIPMIPEGLVAVRELEGRGIHTNVTLVFSPNQALLAAKAGASYVSPFVGRLDGIGQDGMGLVRTIMEIYTNYGYGTEVIVASIRHPGHVLEAARAGAHIATIPYKVIGDLAKHPLTDTGLAAFMKDWESLTA